MQKSRLWMFAQSMPLAAFVVAASACGGSEPAPPAAEAPAAAPAPAPAAPDLRVFFIEPQDCASTVAAPSEDVTALNAGFITLTQNVPI